MIQAFMSQSLSTLLAPFPRLLAEKYLPKLWGFFPNKRKTASCLNGDLGKLWLLWIFVATAALCLGPSRRRRMLLPRVSWKTLAELPTARQRQSSRRARRCLQMPNWPFLRLAGPTDSNAGDAGLGDDCRLGSYWGRHRLLLKSSARLSRKGARAPWAKSRPSGSY